MNDQTNKTQELEERLLRLSVRTIKLLQNEKSIPQSVKTQLIKSVTSIGANYDEAVNAISKADFRNKIFISKKEANESRYWLKIIQELVGDTSDYLSIENEISELIKIFQAIVNTMKRDSDNGQ